MILSCSEATRLASQRMERPLRFGERIALRIHLGICTGCTRFAGQIEFLRRAMRALDERAPGDQST